MHIVESVVIRDREVVGIRPTRSSAVLLRLPHRCCDGAPDGLGDPGPAHRRPT
jgi:hypothetical protein